MPTVKSVLDEVKKLTPFERAEVIERIIESFDDDSDQSIQQAWADEAEKRIVKHKSGRSKTMSEDEVFKSLIKQTGK